MCRLFYSKELGASKSDVATCNVLKSGLVFRNLKLRVLYFYSKKLGASKSDGVICDVLKFQVTDGTHTNANPE